MITPFTASGELDVANLERVTEFLADHVQGLFICGSYGSGPMMSLQERKKVAEVVKQVVGDRVTVVAHTGTTNTQDTVELSRHAKDIGCDAVAAVGPFYYRHGEDGVLSFYDDVVKAVGDYPVYVYNNPQFQGYEMSLDTVKRLKDLGVAGIKDATFNILTFATYMRKLADESFDVALGTESAWLAARSLGCEAYIPGLGNAFPELCVKMWREGMADDFASCRTTQFLVNRLRDIMYVARSTQLAVYAMVSIRGIAECYPRRPFLPPTPDEKNRIEAALKNAGVL